MNNQSHNQELNNFISTTLQKINNDPDFCKNNLSVDDVDFICNKLNEQLQTQFSKAVERIKSHRNSLMIRRNQCHGRFIHMLNTK